MLVFVLVLAVCPVAAAQDAALPAYHFVPQPHNWMNDPNGPFYDPVHQMYHLMYQYLTPRVWGHAASRDLVHWTQLPVALDTDMWYDKGGVYSGSATILDDEDLTPVLSYSVSTNDMMCLAYPANRSDPFLVKWVKSPGNPIISTKTGATPGRDPTTAWRGGANQSVWRMGYGTEQGVDMYVSNDFATWVHAGLLNLDDLTDMWECPDFYPIPNGGGHFLLKASTLGRDYWSTGSYDDNLIRFIRHSGDIGSFDQLYDYGPFYASKTFFDPSLDRQVLWGWVLEERNVDAHGAPYGWASVQSLPRSIVMHSDGVRIRTVPIPELAFLRRRHATLPEVVLIDGQVASLNVTGNQLEVTADLVWKSGPPGSTCGFHVLASADGREFTRMGLQSAAAQDYMPGTDLPGGDYNVTDVNYRDPHVCQAACLADSLCAAWTYVVRPPLYASCCLKGSVPAAHASATCTSGVRSGYAANVFGDTTHSSLNTRDGHAANLRAGPLPLTSPDTVRLHLFVDHSVLELFAADGLAAITRRAYPMLPAGGAALFANGATCAFTNIEAWELAAAV